MVQDSSGRCASAKAAASPQQPWKKFIRGLILPKQSSREKGRCQRIFEKYCRQEESSSSSEETFNNVPFSINERLKCIGCNKRRPSFSDTESVLDIIKMPVGTTNPVLKSSFSLTSLRSSTPTDSPEHGTPLRLKTERAYNSLKKKSRHSNEQDKEQWRKSWGSGISQDGKEFWEGFQADYDYLMAQNILDRDVPDLGTENGIPRAPLAWSHSEFVDHFAQLYSWLKSIQDSVHGKEENVTDWKLRAERLEDMQRQRFRLENFKEESKNMIARHPESEGEVLWRVRHITEKWNTVESMMSGCEKCEGEKGSKEKIEHEIKCLRKWLRELDTKLKPLSFQRGWTKAELEAKSKELMVLHRDIEGKKKIFSSLIKRCKTDGPQNQLSECKALEKKYHLKYLNSLEWQFYIDALIKQNKFQVTSANVSNESDGEPVPKIPRVLNPDDSHDSGGSTGLKSDEDFSQEDDRRMDTSLERINKESPTCHSPPNTMMGVRAEGIASMVGTNSKNANDPFSCANHGTESTSKLFNGDLKNINTAAVPEINRSKERLPNTGSFSCIHQDTESEQEKPMSEEESTLKKEPEGKDADSTSSECGWTYKSSTPTETVAEIKPKAAVSLDFNEEVAKPMKKILSVANKEPIPSIELAELADELVRRKPVKTLKTRRRRTKRGSKEKVLDSCDASWEYTEDSDECQKSDGEGSFTPCRRYGSADRILDGKTQLEFVPRRQKDHARHRPWSMTNITWLRTPPRGQNLKSRSSMSESALNQIIELEKYYSAPGRGNKTIGGEDGSGGSSRKRRSTKIRKLSKKSDSRSDGLTLSGSDSASASSIGNQIATLVKSNSSSGVARKHREICCSDSVTGTETEEEANGMMVPVFRLGPNAGAVTSVGDQDKTQVEEQLSLNWDHYYQEKYQSEVCSEEPPDSDTAKKLWEFGEDYGKFLGNQSDSDVDEMRQTFRLWEIKFNKTVGGFASSDDGMPVGFLDEIVEACGQNIERLTRYLIEVRDETLLVKEHDEILNVGEVFLASDAMTSVLSSFNAANMVSVQVQTDYVKESWETLKSKAKLLKAKHQVRREFGLLREELLSLAATVDAMEMTVTTREELDAKITQIQNELNLMKKKKKRLLQANVSVHVFLENVNNPEHELKEEVVELYELWEETFRRVSSQLLNLQSLSQTWLDFEDHLTQLQCTLRTDTLKVLDFALKCGSPSADASVSVQDIAGILSDKGSETVSALSTEGSLSDSGISDSGSEQELSDREKRLAQLKRLAKRLESILAPGSQAHSNMFQRIEQAESELRELQKTCRDLIVRSASTEEIRMIVANAPSLANLDFEGSATPKALPSGEKSETPKTEEIVVGNSKDGEDSEGAKSGKKFWLWRLLRYSLPFQLALVAFLCIASVMEPRCCDSLNNLELSLNPQLRYDSGPPPV